MLDKSWDKKAEDKYMWRENYEREYGYLEGAENFQKRVLEEIDKEIQLYGTGQADIYLGIFKELVLNLKAI